MSMWDKDPAPLPKRDKSVPDPMPRGEFDLEKYARHTRNLTAMLVGSVTILIVLVLIQALR